MRWSVILCVALVSGCQQLEPAPQPTELPGPVAAGEPEAPIAIAGELWDLCTAKQLKAYPPVLDTPAPNYYAGPWCMSADGGTRFLWTYAEPLFTGENPQKVRGYVNADADLLVRGLRTTGYELVRSSPKDDDVFYEARRPTSPNVVRIEVLGSDPPPEGEAYTGTDPLRLTVAVRKAGPDDTPAPTP